MNDTDLLKAELRAVREELARRDYNMHHAVDQPSLVVPPRSIFQARLKELSTEQLTNHKKRLLRDLDDLTISNPKQLYRDTTDDTQES